MPSGVGVCWVGVGVGCDFEVSSELFDFFIIFRNAFGSDFNPSNINFDFRLGIKDLGFEVVIEDSSGLVLD